MFVVVAVQVVAFLPLAVLVIPAGSTSPAFCSSILRGRAVDPDRFSRNAICSSVKVSVFSNAKTCALSDCVLPFMLSDAWRLVTLCDWNAGASQSVGVSISFPLLSILLGLCRLRLTSGFP